MYYYHHQRLAIFLLIVQLAVSAPVINWSSPSQGGIAGGTILSLSGGGFATDAYTSSNVVWLEGDDGLRIICDFISYTATHHRIECRTRPYPNATEGQSYPPLRIAILTDNEYYISSLTFTYSWSYTYPVELVRPSSGPIGSIIEIAGISLPNAAYTYDRLYLGDLQCDHINNETNLPYRIHWYWNKRHVQCTVENVIAGGYNASIQFRHSANNRGMSWNDSEAMYMMYDDSLAMYELYPDIHSVSPHAGSTEGGTLITVTGSGFGTNVSDIEIDVNGIPCQVMSHNSTHIQCWTGRPHDNDPSIADNDGYYYSITESGHRFKGSRGVSVWNYHHGSISNLATLRTNTLYPDSPSSYTIYPSYTSEDDRGKNTYGERFEAFFNPQATGYHSFFVAADDQAEVFFGLGNNISNVTTSIAGVYSAVGWSNYYIDPANQRSNEMWLEKGKEYLLVSEMAEHYGADYINVAVLMHETAYKHSQTQQSNRETQLITISTTGHYEIQSLRILLNATELVSLDDDETAMDGVVLMWDSDRTVTVTTADILTDPSNAVMSSLLSLFWGQCSYITDHGIFFIQYWNNAIYGFEANETHSSDGSLWLAWNADTPVVVRNESLCGRSSLYLREGRGLVFDLLEDSNLVIELEDYPYYMCLAYKLPQNYAFSLMFQLRGLNYWHSAYFINDVISLSGTTISMGSIVNLGGSDYIIDDNKWHYTCIDLQAIIANGFILPDDYEYNGVHFLEAFGFYADQPDLQGFYLDEVSFSHSARNLDLAAYSPPAHPNGIILNNITATNDTVAMDDGLVAVTITLEFNPLQCGYNFTQFTAEQINTSQSVIHDVSVETIQKASQPLGGFFTLVVNGNDYSGETTPLSYDATTDEIKFALEAISGIGTVTVTNGPFLGIDHYQTGCPGRLIYVQFDDLPGDQPMIVVNSESVSGDDVSVIVSEVVPGGLMASPIPGHMLQTVERTPQVHVKVKGQLAACSGGYVLYHEHQLNSIEDEEIDFCHFTYSPLLTPHVSTITPLTASYYGDTVIITGSGFGNDSSLILVLFGDVRCLVTSVSNDEVMCELGEGVAGYKEIFLQVAGGNGGIAVIDESIALLEYSVVIATVTPNEGSQAGGTEITITGMGFSLIVSDSNSMELDPENETLSDAYKRALVANGNGCNEGWETLVTVGGNECDIITLYHMTITCITPANQNAGITDIYDVIVQVRCTDNSSTPLSAIINDGFTYSNHLTPEVTGVTPNQGTVYGGNSITITGTGFSDDPSEIFIKLGGSNCAITFTNLTTITCTSPAHSGVVGIVVMVTGKGFASGVLEYEYIFTINSLSHCSGSLFGGQLLDIRGEWFGTDSTQFEVLLGDHTCNVNEISDTLIRCITSPTATTHIIDNNATSMEYGLGYVWNPDEITITVGDSILWNWYGTSFTRRLSVVETSIPGDLQYNGVGFKSSSSTRGSFIHQFTEAGDYYYIASGFGHIGFNGTIHVIPLSDITVPLNILVNSEPIVTPDNITCGAMPTQHFMHYTYAVDQTPVVMDTSPQIFTYQNQNDVFVTGLAATSEHNMFTIGGAACSQSGSFSLNLVQPNYSGPSDNTIVYHSGEMTVVCELDIVKPGLYTPVLHVAGRGWGLVTAVVEVLPTYSSAHSSDPSGSLRGGALLEISVRGLTIDDITRTRVEIGNTPCSVHNIDVENEVIYCVTQSAYDDGYSSIVHALQPLTYWTLQTDHYDIDGNYEDSDGESMYRCSGELGAICDASVRGDVIGRQEGISSNSLTNQAALFNKSYIEVPFHSDFTQTDGFGMGLWLKFSSDEEVVYSGGNILLSPLSESGSTPDEPLVWGSGEEMKGPYRIVVDFASFIDGVAHGYVIVINPCGQLEFWLASNYSISEFSGINETCTVLSTSDCSPSTPDTCSGYSVVTTATTFGDLPPGVWSVIRCSDCDLGMEWSLISVGWNADENGTNCEESTFCLGEQTFHFNDQLVATVTTTHTRQTNSSLLIGGTNRVPLTDEDELTNDDSHISSNLVLTGFTGFIDEVCLFGRSLTNVECKELYDYGTSEKQKIWIRVESVDGTGMGRDIVEEWNGAFEEVEILDWDAVNDSENELDKGKALKFIWPITSLKGVWEVTKETYESCDVIDEPIKEWSPTRLGGEVVVWMENGITHYFIDPVSDNCLNGGRLKVHMGLIQTITWTIDHTYTDIIISEDSGLLFNWNGPTPHNLIEMSSPQSTSEHCTYVGSNAAALGKVVNEWQADASTSGEIVVSGLSPGNHYFVCSVSNHCQRGMRINVTVTTEDQQEQGRYDVESPADHVVSWRIQDYSPLTILQGDIVTFIWEGFHSLHQVDKESYESCDVATEPLYIWGIPSVDTTVLLTDLQPGNYYFICSIAGHCDAGMKIEVIVLPSDNVPTLLNPAVAICNDPNGCSYVYSASHTPQLIDIQPITGIVGTELVVNGYGLIPHNSSISTVTILIGHAPCSNVTIVTTSDIDTLSCTVTNYEAGYHFIDIINDRGLASVSPSPLTPGPHRNISEPQGESSPYPNFFLSPVVTSITPDTGSIHGGTIVTITGSGFSLVAGRMNVLLGNRDCEIISSTYADIVCVTSESGDGVEAVRVTVSDFVADTDTTYNYTSLATPTVYSVTPATGIGGSEIVITGTNFGTDASSVSVFILNGMGEWKYDSMESSCIVSIATDTSLTCSLPIKPAGSYVIIVHVSGKGLAMTTATIEYSLTISSISPTICGNGGGVDVMIDGGGFPDIMSLIETENGISSLSVWVCSTECQVSNSSLTQITCVLDTPSNSDVSSVCNDIRVSYNGMLSTATESFEFSDDITPRVTSISPLIGGTAGGTIITITGHRLLPPGTIDPNEDDILVTIDGAVCVWFGLDSIPNDTYIECRTSEHHTTLLTEVKVFVRSRGFAIPETSNTQIWYQYIDRWSSIYTWGGESLPSDGDSVLIQQGQILFLDIDTPILNLIVVEGELIFEDKQDLHLQAKYIFINTGRLQVGTEESPFQHTARITLHGTVRDPEIPIYGAKVLAVRQGDLDLHGRPRIRTWTRLAATALANSTTVVLVEPVDWGVGDQIVIAATGKNGNETEENEIETVSDDGLTIFLKKPLQFEHLGVTEIFDGGHSIDMRGEVGLLSHNVIIEGAQSYDGLGLGEDQYGVQIMIHRSGPYSTPIRIEHTEVRYAGQAFRLGRYAIHFHLTGSMIGSYVRNCAIHHSNNRALTAHGVHDLLIQGNVAYDIKGHTFFVEDGIETNNSYIGNLGMVTRGSSSLLNTDQIPATFWITNPQNTFIGNAAVASRGYGFWYDLDRSPSGASYTSSVCPNKEPFGQFRDNTAHSCNEFGLRIWESYTPLENGCHGGNTVNATLYNFTTYNNGIHGVEFSIVGHVIADNFKIADNVENGFEVQETTGVEWGEAVLKNSLIIGHTSYNHGNPQQGGIETINRGKFLVSNVTFVNFDLANSVCIRACSQCKEREGGFQIWFEELRFYNSVNKTAFQWEHEVLFRDLDGSLTGYVPDGGWVLPNSLLLPHSYCTLSVPEFSANPTVGGASCTSDVYFLRLAWNQAQPKETLTGLPVNVTNEFGHSVVPWRHYRRTHGDGYMCTIPASYPYTMEWNLPIEHEVDITSYSAGVYNIRPTDHVTITHNFVQLPDHVEIGGNYQPTQDGEIPQYGVHPHLSWHINNDTNHTTNVTYLISGENAGADYNDLLFDYQYQPCPRDGCIIVDDTFYGDKELRRWSDNSSWTNGQPPREGDDVTILPQWYMILDISPPPLGQVFVHGELHFEDGKDYNFTANLILIHGPGSGMTIGTAESPFQNRVILTLTGRRRDNPFVISPGPILGSKAIGVFGNVSMHGKPRDVTWTRLSLPAMAGANTITVATSTGWLPGDQIVIAPSGWGVTEHEVRTITHISGQDIILDEPLEFDHEIFKFLDPSDLDDPSDPHWWNDGGHVAPEVGLLSHNIVIQGGEDEDEPLETNHYGCRVLVGRYQDGSTVYSGLLWLQSVEFRHCGQGGYYSPRDPRYTIAFRSSRETSVGSYIRDCAIHHGYNTAIGVHSSNGVEVSRNVVWRTVDSAFKIGGLDNRVLDNLAIFTTTVQPNEPLDNHAVDFPACFDVDGDNVVRGNAAAGSTRLGFRLAGEPCLEDRQPPNSEEATIWGNTAHTGMTGLVILGLPTDCTAVTGFTATHQWDYAIFSSTASSLVASHLRLSVGKVGLNLNVFGPDPVHHFIGGKTITVTDSIIIGSLPGQSCSTHQPEWIPQSSSISVNEPSFGVMMSSFNQLRSKMSGISEWHLMKGYPVIDGALYLTNITFARFLYNTPSTTCPYNTFAIGNNPLSPDAVHPAILTGTLLLNCDTNSLVFFYDPNPGWITQEDCIDMDCDGPKHALIEDRDGLFVGSHPIQGSVAPFAELRFSDYSDRLPVSWLANVGYDDDSLATPTEVLAERGEGVARGEFNVDCKWMETWNAYRCQSLDHRMLVIESLDADTETRRLSPIALDGGNTGHGPYTDLLNGPMDHGWCTYYTCLKRLSTFFTIVAMGTDYHIWMTGSNPSSLRFHVLNSSPEEAIRLYIWYKNPQRKDVYKDGVYIEATNTLYLESEAIQEEGGDKFIPSFTNHSGANYFNRNTQFIHLLIKGSIPIEIRTAPVVQVAVNLAVSLDDFFDPNDLIYRLAFVLKIDPSTIRVVNIVAEDSVPSNQARKRRQVGSGGEPITMTTIVLEFGDPPDVNISQATPPSIAEEIHMAGEINDSVDTENEFESTNQTLSENQLNVDPPQSLSEYISNLNDSVNDYVAMVEEYLEQANITNNNNMIAEAVINAILTDQVDVENATITGVTVIPAPPPPAPVAPVIPPQYENVTSESGEDNVTLDLVSALEEVLDILEVTEVVAMESTPETIVGEEGADYVIPDIMLVTMEPREETGHLVHVKLTIFDVDGEPVKNLGLVTPWMCEASLVYNEKVPVNERARLEGVISVPFVNGVAEFTRLRVDRNADQLTLSFTTVPSRFQAETSVDFSVVRFPDSVEKEQVSFLLFSDSIPPSVDWNVDEIGRQLGNALDVDPSRIQDVTLQLEGENVLYIEFTLLGPHTSDPPNVPSLDEAEHTLQLLVDSGQLTIELSGVMLTSVTESYGTTPSSPSTIPTSTSDGISQTDIILIVVVGGASTAVSVSLVVLCIACCYKHRHGNKGKKGKLSGRSSLSQLPRLRPTFKVNPIADDIGDSSDDDNIEVVPSYRPSSHLPVTQTPNTALPSSPDLWDYDQDEDTDDDDTSSLNNRSQVNSDCWTAPMYATPTSRFQTSWAGSKFSSNQPTTLTVLANPPSSISKFHHPSHDVTYVQPSPHS